MGKLLSKREMAEILGCSVRSVENLVANGKLPFIKVGRLTRFNPEQVEKTLLAQSQGGVYQS